MEMTVSEDLPARPWDAAAVPLLTQLRGGVPDLSFRGFACLVDAGGKCLWSMGDPHAAAFFRSAAKPLQALALVESGAADAAGLDAADLAVICGSHAGDAGQVEQVKAVLAKSDVPAEALRCGGGLGDQCSGKHAGMLTACRRLGMSEADYTDPGHPWQRRMLSVICEWCAADAATVAGALDGCSAPTFALPVYNMALGFARLARAAAASGPAARLLSAMALHPELTGEPDLRGLPFAAGPSSLPAGCIAKIGADGVHCAALPASGVGFALKTVSGSPLPRWPVFTRALEVAGCITEETAAAMRALLWPRLETRRGETAGGYRLEF